jgi:hypothetical protein
MEYGHTWGSTTEIDPILWEQKYWDAVAIAKACAVLLVFDMTDPEIFPITGADDPDLSPHDFSKELCFIGIDGGSEWFNIARRLPDKLTWSDRVETCGATYDLIVVACLAVLAESGLWVGSCAPESTWRFAARLAKRILKRDIAIPKFDR